jgi:hypothetical protein
MRMTWFVSVMVVGALAASCDSGDCDAPDTVEYQCEPMPAGSPHTCASYGDQDPSHAYPVGCDAKLPECDQRWGSAATVQCTDILGGAPTWNRLL